MQSQDVESGTRGIGLDKSWLYARPIPYGWALSHHSGRTLNMIRSRGDTVDELLWQREALGKLKTALEYTGQDRADSGAGRDGTEIGGSSRVHV